MVKSPASDWRIWQDQAIAQEFVEDRRRAVPGAREQFYTLGTLLQRVPNSPMDLLDLGCGDGTIAEWVMKHFASNRVVAVDGSEAMLALAHKRFLGMGLMGSEITRIHADFSDAAWIEKLPFLEFDAIVSGFAIHHIEDDEKQRLYKEIFGLLKPGGVFVNIEHVLSSGAFGEELFERLYAESIAEHRRADGNIPDVNSIYAELRDRSDKSANRLDSPFVQCQWLEAIGFSLVDCYWKWYELAVIAGYRPA